MPVLRGTRRYPVLGGGQEYYQKVLALGPIAYWPLWEASGSVAYDASGNSRNGAYPGSGVTYGQVGVGDGRTSVALDGTNGYVNAYSTSLRDAFNGSEGSIIGWAIVDSAGDWTDGNIHRPLYFAVDGDNRVYIQKAVNNQLDFVYEAGNVTELHAKAVSSTDWMFLCITWSKTADEFLAYYNGVTVGAASTTLGTWAGNLTSTTTCLGSLNTTPLQTWIGRLAHWAVFTSPLTGSQVLDLYTV